MGKKVDFSTASLSIGWKMAQYFKILFAAFVGAFATAAIISTGSIFSGNINGYPLFVLLGTTVGFVGYGLPGSVLWWGWHRFRLGSKPGFQYHKLSAMFLKSLLNSVEYSSLSIVWLSDV